MLDRFWLGPATAADLGRATQGIPYEILRRVTIGLFTAGEIVRVGETPKGEHIWALVEERASLAIREGAIDRLQIAVHLNQRARAEGTEQIAPILIDRAVSRLAREGRIDVCPLRWRE